MSAHIKEFETIPGRLIVTSTQRHRGLLFTGRGASWADCSCGWGTRGVDDDTKASSMFTQHVVFSRRQPIERSPMPQSLGALALAELHVSRCPACGDYTWDGNCQTCVIVARKYAAKKAMCVTRPNAAEAARFEAALDRPARDIPKLAALLAASNSK